MVAKDGYDPSASKGGSLSQLFCGNCCRKDTQAGELQMPNDAPIQYAKADERASLSGLEPPAASRDKSKDESVKAGGVDTRLPPKAQEASAASGEEDENGDSEGEESEWEEGEESEEEPANSGPPAASVNTQKQSIEALKKSWEPLKQQLDSNPKPKWLGTRQHTMSQIFEEDSNEEEEEPENSPDARKHEIAKLKASFTSDLAKISSTASMTDKAAFKRRSSPDAQGYTPPTDNPPKGPSANGSKDVQALSSMEATHGSVAVSDVRQKKKDDKCSVM